MSERSIEKPLTGRRLTDPRDTFDFTTPNLNVTARPTDPYVAPRADSGASQLAQALGLMQNTAQQYAENKAQQNKEDYQKGQLDRVKGKQQMSLEDKKRTAYIKGWENLDGELQAQEFERQSKDFLDLHKDEDYETFKTNYDNFSRDFIKNLGTDDTIKGFIDRGLDTENRIMSSHHEYQQKKIKEEQYTKVTSVLNNDVDNWLTSTLGIKSLDDLINSDDAYLKYYSNKDEFTKQFSEEFSQYRKDAKAKYGVFFDDKELGKIMYQVLKSKANHYDMPELMSVMGTSDGDMREVDNINQQDDLYGVLESSSSGQAKRLATIQKKSVANEEAYVNTQANYYYSAITALDPNDIAGAKKIMLELNQDKKFLASGKWSELYTQINTILDSEGFPKKSDEHTYYALDEKRWKGTLTYKDLVKNRESLSKSDYDDLRGHLETERRRDEDEAERRAREDNAERKADEREAKAAQRQKEAQEWETHKREMSQNYDSIMDTVKQSLKIDPYTNPKKYYEAQSFLGSLIREFKSKNKREPQGSEWNGISDSFFKRFPAGLGETSQTSKTKATITQKPQNLSSNKSKLKKKVKYNTATGKLEEVE